MPPIEELDAGYSLRAATKMLGTDLAYSKHAINARYGYTHDNQSVEVRLVAGVIYGRAPLFERFVLGDSSTLRGWNKYDLDPLGGNRLAYGSVTYGYRIMRVFYDTGSVWDEGKPVAVKQSAGIGVSGGLGIFQEGAFLLAVAFPMRAGPYRSDVDCGNEFLTTRPKRHLQIKFVAAPLLLAALIGFELLGLGVSTEELLVHAGSGDLHVIAPHLHFLTGKSLQRLLDGAVVPFDFQLSLAAGSKNNVVARALERFTVSYDVWQEKFSVIRLRDFRKSNLNLSADAAEAWCLDNIFVSYFHPAGARPTVGAP